MDQPDDYKSFPNQIVYNSAERCAYPKISVFKCPSLDGRIDRGVGEGGGKM
jgi:hypothetical protein